MIRSDSWRVRQKHTSNDGEEKTVTDDDEEGVRWHIKSGKEHTSEWVYSFVQKRNNDG